MKVNRIVLVSLAVALSVLSAASHAQATSDFKVKLDLASRCFVNIDTTTATSQATGDVTLSYDAFQTADEDGSTSFNVRCTDDLSYDVSVDSDTGTIAGINYFLKLAAGAIAQHASASAAGNVELTAREGTGLDQQYTIGVRAPAGQAGQCAGATCNGEITHTITVSY